jgi:HK97 family phage major capsid protein
MNPELQSSLNSISTDLKGFGARFDGLQKQVDAIDIQLARKLSSGDVLQSGEERLKNIEGAQKAIRDKRGPVVFTLTQKDFPDLDLFRKTTITSGTVGTATTGVLQIDRVPGITIEPRQQLTVRDLLVANPTTMQVIDFVRVSQPLTIASPVPEASIKPENQLNFSSVSEKVRLLATWIPATRQILDDMSELWNFIATSLPYYVDLCEELQLLSGDATGENLHGLIPQATAFVPIGAAGSYTRIDQIGQAISQITTAKELQPTFAVVHPQDWWKMRLQKDSLGRYVLGDPSSVVDPKLFGLTVVPTTSIALGGFLVGNGTSTASEIRDRMEMQVEISTEHASYFVQNMVAVRAEKRLALIVKRPASYIFGSFAGASPQ